MDFASNNATAMISSENLSTSPRLKKIQEQDSFKFAVECRNMLLPYVLSPSQLVLSYLIYINLLLLLYYYSKYFTIYHAYLSMIVVTYKIIVIKS